MGDRYGAKYTIYGALDLDALLAEARPRSRFEAWRPGDRRPTYTVKSSGLTIEIGEHERSTERAVRRFLAKERAFLTIAARYASRTVWNTLSCRMWVFAKEESLVYFSRDTLRLIADSGVDLVVHGYPVHRPARSVKKAR
jgi:hypothetical protein